MSNIDNFIKGMASIDHPKTNEAINSEFASINEALLKENDFNLLENNLGKLKDIAYRFPNETIELLSRLIDRLENIELTYEESDEQIYDGFWGYRDHIHLIIKSLECLERIRYFDVDSILNIFLKYSVHKNENIRNKAIECFKTLSEYNLHLIYGD